MRILTHIGKMEKEISKSEFLESQAIVEKYNRQVYRSLIKDLTCICCKKNIVKPLAGYGLDYGSIKASEQEKGMWDNGTVQNISYGYGSRFDTTSFFAAICDDCAEELLESNLVVDVKKIWKEEEKLFNSEK